MTAAAAIGWVGGGSFSPVPLLWLLAIDAALVAWAPRRSGAAMCAISLRHGTQYKEHP
jgi:hypothetical protein